MKLKNITPKNEMVSVDISKKNTIKINCTTIDKQPQSLRLEPYWNRFKNNIWISLSSCDNCSNCKIFSVAKRRIREFELCNVRCHICSKQGVVWRYYLASYIRASSRAHSVKPPIVICFGVYFLTQPSVQFTSISILLAMFQKPISTDFFWDGLFSTYPNRL